MSTENQTQELTIIDPKEYGLEPVKATEMTSGLNSIIEERKALEAMFKEVILKELNDETLKEARSLRLNVRDNRTKGIEVWHKTNKAFYLAGGRFVDAVKNKEVAINERMESRLDEIENHFKVLEEKRLTQLKADRVALLEPYGEVNPFFDLKSMDEVTFNNLLADTKLAYETRRENERKAEEQRIADEKKAEQDRIDAEKKAEAARLEKEKADKLERERIEKENAELKKQQEQREEAEKQRIAKELAKVEKFAKMLVADGFELSNNDSYIPKDQHRWCKDEYSVSFGQLTLIESGDELKELIDTTNNRISERKRLEKEQADKDAEIAKLKAEQEAEKKRLQDVENERIAKQKALANAGDKEKIKAFFTEYVALIDKFPTLTSEDGKLLQSRATEALFMVKKLIIDDSKKLI